jgi:hypothetical protein
LFSTALSPACAQRVGGLAQPYRKESASRNSRLNLRQEKVERKILRRISEQSKILLNFVIENLSFRERIKREF